MKRLYFAYGANMNPDSMSWRCPNATNPQKFVVKDWQLKFHSHATIEPVPGSEVWGMLWELTPKCEHALDMFEGFPFYYTKRQHVQDGVELFFYEMVDNFGGIPSQSYVDDIHSVYQTYGMPVEHLIRALDEQYSYNN